MQRSENRQVMLVQVRKRQRIQKDVKNEGRSDYVYENKWVKRQSVIACPMSESPESKGDVPRVTQLIGA